MYSHTPKHKQFAMIIKYNNMNCSWLLILFNIFRIKEKLEFPKIFK